MTLSVNSKSDNNNYRTYAFIPTAVELCTSELNLPRKIQEFEKNIRQIEFVGENLVADYEGPTHFGFKAFHLVRGEESKGQVIGSLGDLIAG